MVSIGQIHTIESGANMATTVWSLLGKKGGISKSLNLLAAPKYSQWIFTQVRLGHFIRLLAVCLSASKA
jgi:hypothetical protein